MGLDPKPKKPRKARAADLPMLPKADPRSLRQQPAPASGTAIAYQEPIPSGPQYEVAVATPAVHQLLEQIVGVHNDGYFKLSLGDEGKTWFLAYKWQHGVHAGCYVMARVHRGELALAALLLAEKVLAVRAGLRRPTKDRYEG